MRAESVRQSILLTLLIIGGCVGWRMTKLKDGEVDFRKAGFYRGTSKPLRVAAGALAGLAVTVLLRLLADAIHSIIRAYVSVGIMVVIIGVAAGSVVRGQASLFSSGGQS